VEGNGAAAALCSPGREGRAIPRAGARLLHCGHRLSAAAALAPAPVLGRDHCYVASLRSSVSPSTAGEGRGQALRQRKQRQHRWQPLAPTAPAPTAPGTASVPSPHVFRFAVLLMRLLRGTRGEMACAPLDHAMAAFNWRNHLRVPPRRRALCTAARHC